LTDHEKRKGRQKMGDCSGGGYAQVTILQATKKGVGVKKKKKKKKKKTNNARRPHVYATIAAEKDAGRGEEKDHQGMGDGLFFVALLGGTGGRRELRLARKGFRGCSLCKIVHSRFVVKGTSPCSERGGRKRGYEAPTPHRHEKFLLRGRRKCGN